jgi:hypothetical protein
LTNHLDLTHYYNYPFSSLAQIIPCNRYKIFLLWIKYFNYFKSTNAPLSHTLVKFMQANKLWVMRSSCMWTPVDWAGSGQAEITGFLRMECPPDMLIWVAVAGDLQFFGFNSLAKKMLQYIVSSYLSTVFAGF